MYLLEFYVFNKHKTSLVRTSLLFCRCFVLHNSARFSAPFTAPSGFSPIHLNSICQNFYRINQQTEEVDVFQILNHYSIFPGGMDSVETWNFTQSLRFVNDVCRQPSSIVKKEVLSQPRRLLMLIQWPTQTERLCSSAAIGNRQKINFIVHDFSFWVEVGNSQADTKQYTVKNQIVNCLFFCFDLFLKDK